MGPAGPQGPQGAQGPMGPEGPSGIVQVVVGTSTTPVNDTNGTPSGSAVATNCSLDIITTGGTVRLDGRFRAATRYGRFNAIILRDGVNLNATDPAEPIWIEDRAGGVQKTKTAEILWTDALPAGTYHYDMVVWESQRAFVIENDLTPCMLMATEVIPQS